MHASLAGVVELLDEAHRYAALGNDRTVATLLEPALRDVHATRRVLGMVGGSADDTVDPAVWRAAVKNLDVPGINTSHLSAELLATTAAPALSRARNAISTARTFTAVEARLDEVFIGRAIVEDTRHAMASVAGRDGSGSSVMAAREALRGADQLADLADHILRGLANNGVRATREQYVIDPVRLEAATHAAADAIAGARSLLTDARQHTAADGQAAVAAQLGLSAAVFDRFGAQLDGARAIAVRQVAAHGTQPFETFNLPSGVPGRDWSDLDATLNGRAVGYARTGELKPHAIHVSTVRKGFRKTTSVDVEGALGRALQAPREALTAARSLVDESLIARQGSAPEENVAASAIAAVRSKLGDPDALRAALEGVTRRLELPSA